MNSLLQGAQSALEKSGITDPARAFLLLQMTNFFSFVNKDKAREYFRQIRPGHLTEVREKALYKSLEADLAGRIDKKNQKGGFVELCIERIASAAAADSTAKAADELDKCEKEMFRRWWQRKRPAWIALISAWEKVDRQRALQLLGKLPDEYRRNWLIQVNKNNPFTKPEWKTIVSKLPAIPGLNPLLEQMLEKEAAVIDADDSILTKFQNYIIDRSIAVVATSEKNEEERQKAFAVLERFIQSVALRDKETAVKMTGSAARKISHSSLMEEEFSETYTNIRQLENVLLGIAPDTAAAFDLFTQNTPDWMHSFVIAHWYGIKVQNGEEAKEAYKKVCELKTDAADGEAWFLVLITRRGLGDTALEIVETSRYRDEMLGRIRRAWVNEDPAVAKEKFSSVMDGNDSVGKFVFAKDPSERANFLREITANGSRNLPKSLWSPPDFTEVSRITNTKSRMSSFTTPYYTFYMKKTPKERRFQEYVRVNANTYYSYSTVDVLLVQALVTMYAEQANEAGQIVKGMWNTMKPGTEILFLDLFRNTVMERCRNVLCSDPELYVKTFVRWMKSSMVDSPLQRQEGNMIRTLSFQPTAPFLYCVLGAQSVGRFSAEKRDKIIVEALKGFNIDAKLLRSCAGLYADDKGLDAMEPPASMSADLKFQWQKGVIDAMTPALAGEILASGSGA